MNKISKIDILNFCDSGNIGSRSWGIEAKTQLNKPVKK